ncbi:hypothetical protein DPEC_G00082410 [Dallia pectoralis]|uniref:Uncharacterized protein n=1 Tax=Dallia pectoralis TaxID=75939 RepID=A0ACC2GYS0_DALPE|nr:hypothetical protein DPEC_G00082410 [Dallia pectoralis]
MEHTGGIRVSNGVLGENEALQQFFDGCQEMGGVLESAVVDTSILEQYLSNEMGPNIMLPESPPYSGSESCSPPQIPDVRYPSHWSSDLMNQEALRAPGSRLPASCQYKELAPQLPPHTGLSYHQGRANSYVKSGVSPRQQVMLDSALRQTRYLSPGDSYSQVMNTPTTHPVCHEVLQQHPSLGPGDRYPQASTAQPPASHIPSDQTLHSGPGLGPHPTSAGHLPVPGCPPRTGFPCLPPLASQSTGPMIPDYKKRRRTESFEQHNHFVPVPVGSDGGGGGGGDGPCYDSDGATGSSSGMGVYQLITWDHYQPDHWTTLYNANCDILPSPGYHVDTDKGFNYSTADESFVCQKKNHFQVTVHIGMTGQPQYIKTAKGPAPIEGFQVKVFGVKLEDQTQQVTIEQSQSDRSKKPFLPVKVDLPGDKITKVTLGRLHFSETTANNMRKKGKPNPDQRYFMMVVGLYATVGEDSYMLVAYMSEKIIVRASNPGLFENDSEVAWQRGPAPDTVVCQGRVGINTDAPDEALVVCGNVKVMGKVLHPSDCRAKQNIQEVDSTEQLRRIAQMRIVEYDYKPEFASEMGIDHIHETGIIAQEVKELLPAAVKEVGDIICSDGEKIENFLMVDKEQIFMENVGAVKQLCKLTDNLENRIQELEVWNTRLAKLKNIGSLRSTSSKSSAKGHNGVSPQPPSPSSPSSPPRKTTALKSGMTKFQMKYKHCLRHKFFQFSIIILVSIMAFCSIAITALYMLTLRDDANSVPERPVITVAPTHTTTSTTAVRPTTTPGPWPPDVDFCSLLYCSEVFCCPDTDTTVNLTVTPSTRFSGTSLCPIREPPIDRRKENFKKIKGAGDWTNTTIQSFVITQTQQVIDYQYCERDNCGPGSYTFQIPISKFVPTNMRVTIQMNTTELLVVHLCHLENTECSTPMDRDQNSEEYAFMNTQGYIHEWPLPVSPFYSSCYHFRSAVAGQADCYTDRGFMGALFTDYHFNFYRRCE